MLLRMLTAGTPTLRRLRILSLILTILTAPIAIIRGMVLRRSISKRLTARTVLPLSPTSADESHEQ